MNPFLACLLVLTGRAYPTVAFLISFVIALYQLISGNLLNLSWRVWVTRRERPGTYWTVLAVELGVILVGIYFSTL
jgi:hypothetical protein